MATTIPDIGQCIELMESFSMWENIRHHSFKVAQVALLLQEELLRSAIEIDRDLVIAGALLHDIAKSKCLDEGCRHAEVGGEICRELNFPEVADIVAHHVILNDFRPERFAQGDFTAVDLVFYADKRVKHDQVVSLNERLDYIMEKYAADSKRNEALILDNFARCRILEQQLFSRLVFQPTALAEQLATRSFANLDYPSVKPLL